MNTKTECTSFELSNDEGRNHMNTQTRPKLIGKITPFLFLVLAVLVPSLFSSQEQADRSSCYFDMDKRMTIYVTYVDAKVVFDQLAREAGCAITVRPFVRGHVTLTMQSATVSEVLVAVCKQVECKYTYDGTHLTISRRTFIDNLKMRASERDYQARLEWFKKFDVRLPEGVSYEDATVSSVLAEISTVSGLAITPREGEGDRQVTLDVSDMTVHQALEAIVRQIDGEGSVMVGSWNGGHTEYRLVDKP